MHIAPEGLTWRQDGSQLRQAITRSPDDQLPGQSHPSHGREGVSRIGGGAQHPSGGVLLLAHGAKNPPQPSWRLRYGDLTAGEYDSIEPNAPVGISIKQRFDVWQYRCQALLNGLFATNFPWKKFQPR